MAPKEISQDLCIFIRRASVIGAVALGVACSASVNEPASTPLSEIREQAKETTDPNVAAEWLIAELLRPGGDASRAVEARAAVTKLDHDQSMMAQMALGLDDSLHGKHDDSSEHYLNAVKNARSSKSPRAPYVAWIAAEEATSLHHRDPQLWHRWKPFVLDAIKSPGSIGWRARGELVDWWIGEEWTIANPNVRQLAVRELGCITKIRLAGPFGLGASADVLRHYPAEAPGPWPAHWEPEVGSWSTPRVLKTERTSCSVSAAESVDDGVFFAESYIELPKEQELIIAAQGALRVWVDDHLVLDRDLRQWGIWPRFGVQVDLGAGRHRIVASLGAPETSIQLTDPQGVPVAFEASIDAAMPYALQAPKVTEEPNLVSRFIRDNNIVDPGDDFLRFAAAYLANLEGQGDIANVLFEPLVKEPEHASGPALLLSADFTRSDPIFGDEQKRDLVHELHLRAAKKDNRLYSARLELALWDGEQSGLSRTVRKLEDLAEKFPDVPEVGFALALAYDRLGWMVEHQNAVLALEKRFPGHLDSMELAIGVHKAIGNQKHADELVEKISTLDPDSEVRFQQFVARNDYDGALAELRRLKKRRPEADSLDDRIHALMMQSGESKEEMKLLEKQVTESPRADGPRLALADARLANGSPEALMNALVDAVAHGAPSSAIEEALDLLAGTSELEPYRLNADAVISAYEATGIHMPGTAARVLDYAAMWIRSDGSSRMLEHEIVRIQSAEGLSRFAEQQALDGLVLNMRVIKKDGRILEPEVVPGKPTVTYPHLEVGDYLETEHVISLSGPEGGKVYVGPRWYFREENVAYARSEFVVVSPAHVALDIETQGDVPSPQVEHLPGVAVHRWRVDGSPSATLEPFSAPLEEIMPSVRIGWGVSLEQRLRSISSQIVSLVPLDPRITRIAKRLVESSTTLEKTAVARKVYRWVLENVQAGDENDGRRVVISKQGNRWQGFEMLCRALDIPVTYVLARSMLNPPPLGPISSTEQFNTPLIRLDSTSQPTFLTLGSGERQDKYLPFGYLPGALRNAEAWTLAVNGSEKLQTPAADSSDDVTYEGTLKLEDSGRATGVITFGFSGSTAMQLRGALEYLPSGRWQSALESGLVGNKIRGATVDKYEVIDLARFELPLRVRVTITIPHFAQLTEAGLRLTAPFMPPLGKLASQATRQTPLLLGSPIQESVKLSIMLPKGFVLSSTLLDTDFGYEQHRVSVHDRFAGGELVLERKATLVPARISPDEYPKFAKFARESGTALNASIRLTRAH